jgi:hypothetical protein
VSPVRDNLEPGRHAHPVDQAEAVLWAAGLEAATAELVARLEAERLRPAPPPGEADTGQAGPPSWLPDLRRLIALLAELMSDGSEGQ